MSCYDSGVSDSTRLVYDHGNACFSLGGELVRHSCKFRSHGVCASRVTQTVGLCCPSSVFRPKKQYLVLRVGLVHVLAFHPTLHPACPCRNSELARWTSNETSAALRISIIDRPVDTCKPFTRAQTIIVPLDFRLCVGISCLQSPQS